MGSRPSRDVPFPISQLTLAEAAQMMREAVKDKSYRATPVGLEVAHFIRLFRNEYGVRPGLVGRPRGQAAQGLGRVSCGQQFRSTA